MNTVNCNYCNVCALYFRLISPEKFKCDMENVKSTVIPKMVFMALQDIHKMQP